MCFHILCQPSFLGRRALACDLDPDCDFEKSQFTIQGSTANGRHLTQKIWNKKEGVQRYLKYPFNSIIGSGSEFGQKADPQPYNKV